MFSFCIFLMSCTAYSLTVPRGPITLPFSTGQVGPMKVILKQVSGMRLTHCPQQLTNLGDWEQPNLGMTLGRPPIARPGLFHSDRQSGSEVCN